MEEFVDDIYFEWEYKEIAFGLDVVVTDCIIAEEICNQSNPDYVISIWDKGTYAKEKYAWVNRKNCLVLEFDDVKKDSPTHGYVAPTMDDVVQIVEFAKSIPDGSRLLVHCGYGISRSSAAAMFAFVARGADLDSIDHLWTAIRSTWKKRWRDGPYMRPNAKMIHLADRLFGFDGELFDEYVDKFNPKVDYNDFDV